MVESLKFLATQVFPNPEKEVEIYGTLSIRN